jgi:hypothetical protein
VALAPHRHPLASGLLGCRGGPCFEHATLLFTSLTFSRAIGYTVPGYLSSAAEPATVPSHSTSPFEFVPQWRALTGPRGPLAQGSRIDASALSILVARLCSHRHGSRTFACQRSWHDTFLKSISQRSRFSAAQHSRGIQHRCFK